jgi:hypothetical protein
MDLERCRVDDLFRSDHLWQTYQGRAHNVLSEWLREDLQQTLERLMSLALLGEARKAFNPTSRWVAVG